MSAGIKTALSLLGGLLVSAAFAVLWFTGSFDGIEAQLYTRGVEQAVGAQIQDLRSGLEQINQQRQQTLQGLAATPAFQNAYRVNQSRADIATRDREAGLLQAGIDGLRSLRVVGPDPFDESDPPDLAIYYSSSATDVLERSPDRIRYRDFDAVYEDAGLDSPSVDAGELAVLVDPERQSLEYRVPLMDENGVRRSVMLAAVTLRGTSSALVRLGALDPGRQLIANPDGTLVADVPELLVADLSQALEARAISPGNTEAGALSDGDRLFLGDGEGAYRIALDQTGSRPLAVLVNEARFELDPALRWVIVSIAGLSTFLLLFLLFNLRQDPEVLVAERMKRVQLEILQENINRSGSLDMESLRAELERRKPVLVRQILRGIKGRSPDQAEQLDQLVEQSWSEIFELMGRRGAPQTPGGNFDAEAFQRIADQIIEGIRQVQVIAPVVTQQLPQSPSGAPAGARARPVPGTPVPSAPVAAAAPASRPDAEVDLADLEPLDDGDELEPVETAELLDEDDGDLEPVEALELLDEDDGDLEPVEALELLDEVGEEEFAAELGEAADLQGLESLDAVVGYEELSNDFQPIVGPEPELQPNEQVGDLGLAEVDLSGLEEGAKETLSDAESNWLDDSDGATTIPGVPGNAVAEQGTPSLGDDERIEDLEPVDLEPLEDGEEDEVEDGLQGIARDDLSEAEPPPFSDAGPVVRDPGGTLISPALEISHTRVTLEPRSVVDSLLEPLEADALADLRLEDLNLQSELSAYDPIDDEVAAAAIRDAESEVAPYESLDAEPVDQIVVEEADTEHSVELGFGSPDVNTAPSALVDASGAGGVRVEGADSDAGGALGVDEPEETGGDAVLEELHAEPTWSDEWLSAGMLFSAGTSSPEWSMPVQDALPLEMEGASGAEDDVYHRVFAASWADVRASLLPHSIVEDSDGTVRISAETYSREDDDVPEIPAETDSSGIGSLFGDLTLDLEDLDSPTADEQNGLERWFAEDGLVIGTGSGVEQLSKLMGSDALLLLERGPQGYGFIGARNSSSRCASVLVDGIQELLDRVTGPALASDREVGLQYIRHGDVGDPECMEMIGLSVGSAICAVPVHGELGQVAVLVYAVGQPQRFADSPDLPQLIRELGTSVAGAVHAG